MIDAVEDYLEKCAQVIVKIDLVESLLRPENLEVSSRYVLQHANYGSSNIFQLTEKPNHLVAQDYVKEGRSTEQEEEEKLTFVPSAVSVLLKPLFRCSWRR